MLVARAMLTALFPIGDDNFDRKRTPFVTWTLISINVLVYVLLQLPNNAFTYGFATIPGDMGGQSQCSGPLCRIHGFQYLLGCYYAIE